MVATVGARAVGPSVAESGRMAAAALPAEARITASIHVKVEGRPRMAFRQVEPLGKVRTKIVATVGPASREPTILRAMVEAGVDVFRLNFSHGDHDEHSATLRAIREVADASGRMLA